MEIMNAPSASTLHPQHGQGSGAYRQGLDNVDATTRTADNVLTVISDPRKAMALLILVLLVVLVYFLFRSGIKRALTSVWDLLAKPFRDLKEEDRRETQVELLTGEKPTYTLSETQALAVADRIYGCINWMNDNEEGLYAELRIHVHSAGDWRMVCDQYGVRGYGKGLGRREAGLEATLSDCLTAKELDRCRTILTGNGVPKTAIGF